MNITEKIGGGPVFEYTIDVIGASAGTFTLRTDSQLSDPINFDASADDVVAVLNALTSPVTWHATGGPLNAATG